MRKLIVIDLTVANTDMFESYERKVVPLLKKYEAELELCVRAVDGGTETHVLYFPDATRFEEFLADPERTALKDELKRTGAVVSISDVKQVNYL